jgi:DNA-binding transcriptional LysR family regulator
MIAPLRITPLRLHHATSLAEHASFRRAAATLRISQPALTKSIQALEASFGVKLFERRHDGVVPTEFGRLVLEHTSNVVHAESELLRQIQQLAGLETGSVYAALGPYPAVISGYQSIGRLMTAHPRLNISLQVTNQREVARLVVERKVDVGVAELTAAVKYNELQTEIVGEHRAHFCCRPGHPILGTRRIRTVDLLAFPWVSTRIPKRVASAFPNPPGAAGQIDPTDGDLIPAVQIDVPMGLASLVSNSNLITFGTFTMVERDIEAGALVVIPTHELKLRSGYGFMIHRGRPISPATREFMQEFRQVETAVSEREQKLERQYLTGKQRSS